MPNGYERVEGARGTPGQTYKADFTINDTTSKQYKFGGTLAPVTMEVTDFNSLGTRTYNNSQKYKQWRCVYYF